MKNGMSGFELSSSSTSPPPLVLPGVDFFEVLQHHHGTSFAKMPGAVPWGLPRIFLFEVFPKQNFRYPKTESSKWTCSYSHVINPVAETIKQNDLEFIDENWMTFGFSKEPLFLFLPELWYATKY